MNTILKTILATIAVLTINGCDLYEDTFDTKYRDVTYGTVLESKVNEYKEAVLTYEEYYEFLNAIYTINDNYEYAYDIDTYGQDDYWVFVDNIDTDYFVGDCEDYALSVASYLLTDPKFSTMFKQENLQLIAGYVEDKNYKSGHLLLQINVIVDGEKKQLILQSGSIGAFPVGTEYLYEPNYLNLSI